MRAHSVSEIAQKISLLARRESKRKQSKRSKARATMIPQLVVHVFVVKKCSEQIYGVFLCFIVTGT